MENFRGFRGLASNHEGFPANFFCLIRCFELLYNRESFPMNNEKIMQPWNFSTANDLHYTVYCNISQYIAMCNILISSWNHIVLYCSNKYCNVSIYCNIVSSLAATSLKQLEYCIPTYRVVKCSEDCYACTILTTQAI